MGARLGPRLGMGASGASRVGCAREVMAIRCTRSLSAARPPKRSSSPPCRGLRYTRCGAHPIPKSADRRRDLDRGVRVSARRRKCVRQRRDGRRRWPGRCPWHGRGRRQRLLAGIARDDQERTHGGTNDSDGLCSRSSHNGQSATDMERGPPVKPAGLMSLSAAGRIKSARITATCSGRGPAGRCRC
jgi:hypothetical protein